MRRFANWRVATPFSDGVLYAEGESRGPSMPPQGGRRYVACGQELKELFVRESIHEGAVHLLLNKLDPNPNILRSFADENHDAR